MPLAHASPSLPQLWPKIKSIQIHTQKLIHKPLGVVWSAGQADELPVHISAWSQRVSLDGRHTCVLGANVHCSVQHWLLNGSQTAPLMNLQVVESQQVLFVPVPGSQSSPCSTIPFPHIWSPTSCTSVFASMRQEVSIWAPSIPRIEVPERGKCRVNATWSSILWMNTYIYYQCCKAKNFVLPFEQQETWGIGPLHRRNLRSMGNTEGYLRIHPRYTARFSW